MCNVKKPQEVLGKKIDLKGKAVASLNSNSKRANLLAAKKERIRLPTYSDDFGGKKYHISEFLSHPSGIAAVLNTKALESFQSLDANTYSCSSNGLANANIVTRLDCDIELESSKGPECRL
ncbi:hypothetical protein V8G54_021794 [Vigna mungo]|uniref:Uncharacterized protein n=1 Tax=Vigna mungo TaxID=3915 RepID=A0AAQ3RX82_VIGMU